MKAFLEKHAFWLIIGLAAIIFLAGRYFGKKKGEDEVGKYVNNLPNAGSGVPEGWTPDALVEELFTAINGIVDIPFVTTGQKALIYKKLIDLTPDQLTAVYNKFNYLYLERGKGTMTDWINDEWNQPLDGSAAQLLTKLQELGLKKAESQDKSWWPF